MEVSTDWENREEREGTGEVEGKEVVRTELTRPETCWEQPHQVKRSELRLSMVEIWGNQISERD